jgi:hypothetical protein
MTPLFKKLNYKGISQIVVLNCPKTVEIELAEISKTATVTKSISTSIKLEFVLCFAITQQQVDAFIDTSYSQLVGDAIVWICYPKMSSKKYTCEFKRDTGWASIGKYNMEPVRGVSINEDFSALRFRKVEYIKKITRKESYALSIEAKNRTTQKGV